MTRASLRRMSYSHVGGRFGDSFSKLTPGGSHRQAPADEEGSAALFRPSRAAIAEKLIEQAQLQADLEFMSCTTRPEASCIPLGGTLEEQKIGIIGGGIAGLYAALILDSLNLTNYQRKECVMKGKPIKSGGQSSTDLPIRTIVYPSYGNDDVDATGVLIASYTWAQDAARISALAASDPEGLLESVIKDLAMVHDVPLDYLRGEYNHEDFFIIKDWHQSEYSQGAFGMFGPSQFATLFPGLRLPEMNCRYHTAGEVSSVHHGWIVGALNSAWRCVFEILVAHGRNDKIKELVCKWGDLEDVERGSAKTILTHED